MNERPVVALRTPLYLILAALGVLIVVSAFLPWATVAVDEGPNVSVAGTGAGGWGLAAIVVGVAIAVIGIIGYFWNPFSDPEAFFIAGFAIAAMNGASVLLSDLPGLVDPASEFFPDASAGIGLILILAATIASVLGAGWILVSRPGAEARLTSA